MTCVLSVQELCGSHGGEHMAKVLHEVLIDYNLTDKVIFFKIFVYYFVLNTCFPCFSIVVHNQC